MCHSHSEITPSKTLIHWKQIWFDPNTSKADTENRMNIDDDAFVNVCFHELDKHRSDYQHLMKKKLNKWMVVGSKPSAAVAIVEHALFSIFIVSISEHAINKIIRIHNIKRNWKRREKKKKYQFPSVGIDMCMNWQYLSYIVRCLSLTLKISV